MNKEYVERGVLTLNEAIIHAREAADRIEKDGCISCANEHRQLADWLEELKHYKSTDVAPVVRGQWIPKADGFWKKQILICSNCESRNGLNYKFNYCPNCGAKMDVELSSL